MVGGQGGEKHNLAGVLVASRQLDEGIREVSEEGQT